MNDQYDYLRRDDNVDTDRWTVAEAKVLVVLFSVFYTRAMT